MTCFRWSMMFFFVCKCISDSGAMARAADRLVLEGNEPNERGQRRPVIIGYGNGRGNGTHEDVEKEKKRLTRIWEVKVREARERNEEEPPLELPSDEELHGNKKTDRDFRICEHCCSFDQPWLRRRSRLTREQLCCS